MSDFVLFHTHGLGRFDFSTMTPGDLPAVDDLANARSAILCPSIYLLAERIGSTRVLLEEFARLKGDGRLPHILGFSIEGPVLGPNGGIPTGSIWPPTALQWREIASWFSLGLTYIVMSPDILALDETIEDGFTFSDLLTLIYDSGGRVALGHFEGSSPRVSAARTEHLLEFLSSRYQASPYLVLTDHLFNDMPRNFKHAFRTRDERASRASELTRILGQQWSTSDLSELLGPVPAVLLQAARDRRLTPSLNFDGGHVDLDICRRVVEHLGSSRVIAITDHTEVESLAGEPLHARSGSSLFFRNDGVLAASASAHEQQRENMRGLGFVEAAIKDMFCAIPRAAIAFKPCRRSLE